MKVGSTSPGNGATPPSGSSSTGTLCSSNDLKLAFAPDMYSAYIPGSTHVFAIPAQAQGPSGTVQWTASDPSAVRIAPNADGGAMLTTLKAGDVTITARDGGRCGTSTLHITEATEEQWQLGNARYDNMVPLPPVPTSMGTTTVLYTLDQPGMPPPACTNCHGPAPTDDALAAPTETPEQTGGFSDQELSDIITQGTVPASGYYDSSIVPEFVFTFFHKLPDVAGEEALAMVVYLRSLTPRPVEGFHDGAPVLAPAGGAAGK